MENFVFDIKTRAYFGKDQIDNLGEILNQYGKRVLFVYGGGSIKNNGLYDRIIVLAKENNIQLVEFGGVEPNPTLKTARKGVELAKSEKVDCVLAVGGGSAMDCGKAIGIGAKYEGDVWDFFSYKLSPKESLPLVGIATIAASGTEMSHYSVITNEETNQKHGVGADCLRFNEVILDPVYTYSVNAYHTAAGVVDAMSHIMEGYFTHNDEYLQNRMSEAVLKTLIEYGPRVIETPNDYESRAQILWASSIAINRILNFGLKGLTHECHLMGHALSAKYDITHGVSLALISPKWYELCMKKGQTKRLAEFGKNVFGLSGDDNYVAAQAIQELSKFFFDRLKMPRNLRELNCGADKKDFKELAQSVSESFQSVNWYVPITAEDIDEIYNAVF